MSIGPALAPEELVRPELLQVFQRRRAYLFTTEDDDLILSRHGFDCSDPSSKIFYADYQKLQQPIYYGFS